MLEYEQYLVQHPEIFVPLLRAQLMALPATLGDFDLQFKDWSISVAPYASGGRPRCLRLLSMLDEYPVDVVDPIVQEFFSALATLALQARDLLESEIQARSEMTAAERVPGRVAFRETIRKHDIVFDGLDGTVTTAERLGSDVLLDDVLALLERDDPSAQETGARYIDYALTHAVSRPEVASFLRRRGQELSIDANERSARVGEELLEQAGRATDTGSDSR